MSTETRHEFSISNPLFVMGYLFLWVGLVLATYLGLEQFGVVPHVSWMSWSHTHYVTVGAFTQLVFAMLPRLTARKLDRPQPSARFTWLTFVVLNGGFLLLWYGFAYGNTLAFDVALYSLWLLVVGLMVVLYGMAMKSDGERAWDAGVALTLLSPFVFLVGITYAYGLFGHVWTVPGGWSGLREAHVHANTWGFLALTAAGTLYTLFPRIVDADLHSTRFKTYSFWFFGAGIFFLITGPWVTTDKWITVTGLMLYATGFTMYFYNLIRTYLAGRSSGIALSMLVAQFWILGPAFVAPLLLFDIDWVAVKYIEQGLIHFFFMGWALPIALDGVVLFTHNAARLGTRTIDISKHADPTAPLPDGAIPSGISTWTVVLWNAAVVVMGFGFFYQAESWSSVLFAAGSVTLLAIWFAHLTRSLQLRLSISGSPASD